MANLPMEAGMLPDRSQLTTWIAVVGALVVAVAILAWSDRSSDGVRVEPAAAPATTPSLGESLVSPAEPGALVADTPQPAAVDDPPEAFETVERRGDVACADAHRLVRVEQDLAILAAPGGRRIGTLPASSRYLGQSMTAWLQEVSADGAFGRVSMPWTKPVTRSGWISLDGLRTSSTTMLVVADLSERRLRVYDGCTERVSVATAIGRTGSPSPTGKFWVTDRVIVPTEQRGSFGTFAFGLSTVQPRLPAGWTGGDQMAIHGTGAPGSIGAAASAGCLRVGESALARLKPLLRVGTPVVIQS